MYRRRILAGSGRRRRAVGSMPTRRRQRGSGFFGDLWGGIKKAANWVKDQKLISKGLGLVSKIAPGAYGSAAGAAGNVAGQLGLGRRRRVRRRRMTGGRVRRVRRRQRGGNSPPGGPAIESGLGLVSVNPGGGAYWPAGDHNMAVNMQREIDNPAPKRNWFQRGWDKFKGTRFLSRGLRGIGAHQWADKAAQAGWGRRRAPARRRVQRGRGMTGALIF